MSGHHVVVIGAGIAGMSFMETFSSLCPDVRISILSASPELKIAHVSSTSGRLMQTFDVQHLDVREVSSSSLIDSNSNVTFFREQVVCLDAEKHELVTSTGKQIPYSFAVICTGARPVPIPGSISSHVLCIRDTNSVSQLQQSLSNSRKVVVVGNGGIATELVFKMTYTHIVWVIRDKSISSAFFDPVSAQFMISSLNGKKKEDSGFEPSAHSRKFIVNTDSVNVSGGDGKDEPGSALGPDWSLGRQFSGAASESGSEGSLLIEYETEVTCVRETSESSADALVVVEGEENGKEKDYPLVVELSNGKNIPCDIVISATGVFPNCQIITQNSPPFARHGEDGGLLVNEDMETSIRDVFAAGDVCYANWDRAELWLQKRLWTQAHQMGRYAAHSVASRFTGIDHKMFFNFEVFTHVTSLFGHKVVLLGLFNGQGLQGYKILLKVEEGKQLIKLILKEGRVKGAIIIGDTGLEETIENLIISQLDVSRIEDNLLEPDIDIEDYFD